jgi:hypothetical protein
MQKSVFWGVKQNQEQSQKRQTAEIILFGVTTKSKAGFSVFRLSALLSGFQVSSVHSVSLCLTAFQLFSVPPWLVTIAPCFGLTMQKGRGFFPALIIHTPT